MSLPTVMQKDFAEVYTHDKPRAKFNRSFDLKTTFDAGYLIPVMVDELVPGDFVNLSASAIARLSTPIYPIMDNMYLDIHFFAVPARLLWTNWQKFMGERENPADTISSYVIPKLTRVASSDFGTSTIFDYMGLPVDCDTAIDISALPFRAYNLIYNEWYRDQNIQDMVTVNTDNGGDALTDYTLLKRNKRHDYFTSCLPWPQRTSAIEVPLVGTAPVSFGTPTSTTRDVTFRDNAGGSEVVTWQNVSPYALCAYTNPGSGKYYPATADVDVDNWDTLYDSSTADLSSATGISINDLRDYITLQQFAELDARGGTRYIEIIKSHFGVDSSDARLQRPEFLGGITHRIDVNAVTTTGGNDSNARAVGDLGAVAYTSFGNKPAFSYSAEEHVYIIGLASARADLTYSQGVDKLFTRAVREDFYFPTFAHLGEQPVYQQEIQAGNATPLSVFGYQERYAEYRYKKSELTALMRPDATSNLAAWHLSQDLATSVALNTAFIEETPPVSRIQAVTTEPDFIANIYFDYMCERPIPRYGVPGLERL